MKKYLLSLIFVSQLSQAARIVNAVWDQSSEVAIVTLAYQGGCEDHEFVIQWDPCVLDTDQSTVTRFGLVLDSGWQDTCDVEQVQTVRFKEPQDDCQSHAIVLKSTSSRTSVVISK